MRIIIPAVAVIGTAPTATLLTAAPATAAPPGCSFHRGTLTCVTTTTTARELVGVHLVSGGCLNPPSAP